MSYNNGKSLNINEISDIEKAIQDFSEGNIYLEKLLLECYKNNIKTFACCTGHENEESLPYIAFPYSKENEQFICCLLSELKDSDVEFSYSKTPVASSYFNLEFKNYDYKCFQIITDIVNRFDKSKNYYLELPEDLKNYFNIINTIEYFDFIEVDRNTNSNYFQFGYIKEEDSYNYFSFSNNFDFLTLLKQSGFKYNDDGFFSFYYIDSNERIKNNEQLQKMNYILNKKVDKLFNSNKSKR